MTRSKIRTTGAEGLTLSSTALTVANGLTLTDGNVTLASGHGIDFAATGDGTTMTGELLDDFEEGTWTPSILNGWGILNPTTSTATGYYTKIGNLVYVLFKVIISGGSTNGNPLVVVGLPFSHDGTTGGSGVYDTLHGYFQSANSNATSVLGEVGNNGAVAIQFRYRVATGLNNFTGTDSGNSGNFTFSGIYRTAS